MSGYRRHIMGRILAVENINGKCNVYNDTFTFYIRLQGESTKSVTVTTDSQGYWRYDLDKKIYSLEASFSRVSQAESNKLVELNFHCDTSNSISMNTMCGRFGAVRFGCTNLTSIKGLTIGSACTNFNAMFQYCSSLEFVEIKNWDLSSGVNCNNSFGRCTSLTDIDLSGLSLSSATSANGFLRNCSSLISVAIPAIPDGCSVTDMFTGDTALTTITECGNIGAITTELSLVDSPLTLASAIVVLSALQDLNGVTATLTFASATRNLISDDSTAMTLVAQAQLKGWTITGF